MIKLIPPGSYAFDQLATHIRVTSGGIIAGADKRLLVKSASERSIYELGKIDKHPGEELIHVFALGATETTGVNRNGDGFSKHACSKYHHTFEKLSRWFRNHRNKDKAKSYGIVKRSYYNPDMGRVELIVALNADETAAKRNGGLVADREMEKLASGDPIATSMACRVEFDVCSGCGNRAKNRTEYCTEAHCKYGGLRSNMGRMFDDGHVLHADNPEPHFFDISHVFRPADRIAYVLGSVDSGFQKAAAAAGQIVSGAEWASIYGVSSPNWLYPALTVGECPLQKLASELAQIEATVKPTGAERGFSPSVMQHASEFPDVRGRYKLAHVFRALSDHNCLLPVEDFLGLITGRPAEKLAGVAERVRESLPGIFGRLSVDIGVADQNPYMPSLEMAPRTINDWARKHAAAWSLDRDRVIERAQLAAIRDPNPINLRLEKSASEEHPLAREYGMYQLAFISSKSDRMDDGLERQLAVLHNYAM